MQAPCAGGAHFVGGCTGFACCLPLVGGRFLSATNGSFDPKGYTCHEVTAPRAVDPADRPCAANSRYMLVADLGEEALPVFLIAAVAFLQVFEDALEVAVAA